MIVNFGEKGRRKLDRKGGGALVGISYGVSERQGHPPSRSGFRRPSPKLTIIFNLAILPKGPMAVALFGI